MTTIKKPSSYALCSTALMTATASLAKLAAHDYHVLQILFSDRSSSFFSTLPLLAKDFPNALKTSHPGLHSLRLSALSLPCLLASGCKRSAIDHRKPPSALPISSLCLCSRTSSWGKARPIPARRHCSGLSASLSPSNRRQRVFWMLQPDCPCSCLWCLSGSAFGKKAVPDRNPPPPCSPIRRFSLAFYRAFP